MAFTMSDIRLFLGKQCKQLEKRGKNFINSEKVLSLFYDRDLKHLQGRVQASKRKATYDVWVDVVGKPATWNSSCGCARAKAVCSHRAALLMQAYKTVSCTSMPCQWAMKKAPESDQICRLSTISRKSNFRPNYAPMDEAAFQRLTAVLKDCPGESGAGVLFLLEGEPTSSAEEGVPRCPVPRAAAVLRCPEVINSDDPVEAILGRLRISWPDVVQAAQASIGQAKNPVWSWIRHCRLTGSRFGDILNAMKKPRPVPSESLLESLLIHKKLDGVKSIQWGRIHEKTAIKTYTKASGKTVVDTGIWLHEEGFFGASPDGLIDDDSVLEVKCPYTIRNTESLEIALSAKRAEKYLVFMKGDTWFLNENHEYYHQIQGSLYCTRREKAVFFIWTPKSQQAFTIMKDPDWADNIDALRRFYFDFFVPYVHSRE